MVNPTTESTTSGSDSFRNLSPDALAEYIVQRHHAHTKRMLPLLATYAQNVALRHGEQYQSLYDLDVLITELAGEMSEHMLKEEQVLFPYIQNLAKAQQSGDPKMAPDQPFVDSPIELMKREHDHAAELMRQIRCLTNDYKPPTDASSPWRLAFSELSTFESDLKQLFHLENEVLFPAAKAMEASLLHAFVPTAQQL